MSPAGQLSPPKPGIAIDRGDVALGQSRPGRARAKSGHVRNVSKAEVISEHQRLCDRPLRVDGTVEDVIQAPKLEPRIMRYELSDYEWTAIKPMLPNKPRGVRRVNDRCVLNDRQEPGGGRLVMCGMKVTAAPLQ
jgi:hypothetical protein